MVKSPGSNRPGSRTAALGVVLASVSLTGCPCDTGFMDFFADEIHKSCDGLPCDWDLIAGQARLVPFLHGGERALEIVSGGVITRPIPELNVFEPVEGSVQVYVLAACDSGTELIFELEARESDESTHTYVARLALGFGSGDLLPRRELPVTLEGEAPDLDRVVFDTLTLRVEGPGRCTLDDLHLTSTVSSNCF